MTPKDTIFLHIGMHKTATTSIQHSLRTYSDGITRYARMGRPNHTRLMISVFGTPTITRNTMRRAGADSSQAALRAHRADNLALLETQINSPERNLIISGEGLAALNGAEVDDLRAFLSARCTRIRLIAYIREPVSFASSGFQQRVQSGKKTEFDVPAPEYRRRFEVYVKTFGTEAIDFVRFAPETFPEGCIITDFSARTGIDASLVDKSRTNESLSNEVVALLLAWNREGVQSFGSQAHIVARKKLFALLRHRFPGKFHFDPAFVQANMDLNDCRWMEDQAGFSLHSPSADRPAGRQAGATGISSAQHLNDLCVAAMPGLREILAQQGQPTRGLVSTVLMNRLYTALLTTAQAETATAAQGG